MTDLKALLDIVQALQTPLLAYVAWLVYRLYSNHLPHILDVLSRLEGAQEERRARPAGRRR